MTELKCRICGGNLLKTNGSKIVLCEHCGTKQVLPLFSEDSAKILYSRGTNYLQRGEYDKAENIFNQLVSLCPDEAEIYWNLVLCKYGITFVKDPFSNKYIPTCNKLTFQSVLHDENYINALKFSDDEKKSFYKSTADKINDIQKDIIAISKKEKPYDIFITYKETDSNNIRTQDSIKAQKLYNLLTSLGYKVFFSRISLENKAGIEYEPYIYAALQSSKVMLSICSSKENIESPWVRNEWSRYLSLMQNNSKKSLIPLFFDISRSELPNEFDILPALDMDNADFEQELIRGINKLIPCPIAEAEKIKQRKERVKKLFFGIAAAFLLAILISMPWLLKIPKYSNAKEMYLNGRYPEAAWAFKELGKFRDSEEMQNLSELSWRKSLAYTVNPVYEGYSNNIGNYYIDDNGNVKDIYENTAYNDFQINQHGKVVSFALNNINNVVYEDGYVTKIPKKYIDNWNDIIQLSPYFDCTTVALRADGTLTYEILVGEEEYSNHNPTDDSWMQPIKEWKNIVAFTWYIDAHCGGMLGWKYTEAAIFGLRSDGKVEIVTSEGYIQTTTFSNAKDYLHQYQKDGTDVSTNNFLDNTSDFKLNENGDLKSKNTNMLMLKDVLYCDNYYAVSKNGNLYEHEIVYQNYVKNNNTYYVETGAQFNIVSGVKVAIYEDHDMLENYKD